MLLLAATLLLYATTEVIGGWTAFALPPLAAWGWWTMSLLACGAASIYERYARFHQKFLGLVSVTLFYASYPLLWDSYIGMMPQAPEGFPWPVICVALNIILPIILVTAGPLLPVVAVEER